MSDLFQVTLGYLLVLILLAGAAQGAQAAGAHHAKAPQAHEMSRAHTMPQAHGMSQAQKVASHPSYPLTLNEAEQLALSKDPLLRRFGALASALKERAVADAQLSDPGLSVGLQDIPTDSFSFTEDSFTMLTGEIRQDFPPGDTLKHRGSQTMAQANAEEARAADEARAALRGVRNAWLEVYYQTEAANLVHQTEKLFSQAVKITRDHFGAGFGNQQDVINAGLELSLLKDREADIERMREAALAELAKWVGPAPVNQSLAKEWALPPIPKRDVIEAGLGNHPLMQVEDAMVRADQNGVDLARDQYKPAWGVGVSYGLRSDRFSDFLSIMGTVSLPIFTDKRQDKRLAASQQEFHAALYSRDDRHRELRQILDEQYAALTRLDERLALHEKELLPQSRQNAQAALNAYQSNVTDFTTLIRARITELETHLSAIRLRVDRSKVQANLLYLAGEQP